MLTNFKMLTNTRSFFVFILLIGCIALSFGGAYASEENEWASAYQDFLNNYSFLDSSFLYQTKKVNQQTVPTEAVVFALYDMNQDSIPELLIKNGYQGNREGIHISFSTLAR